MIHTIRIVYGNFPNLPLIYRVALVKKKKSMLSSNYTSLAPARYHDDVSTLIIYFLIWLSIMLKMIKN